MIVKGFFHVLSTEIGRSIATATLSRIMSSGLYEVTDSIHIGEISADERYLTSLPAKATATQHTDVTLYEGWTLNQMYRDAQTVDEAFYWYIHTKGASHKTEEAAASWRNAMSACVIDDYAWCISQLSEPEVCSCGPLLAFNPHPFYAGNFWWTKASYVRQLASPDELIQERLGRGLNPDLVRFVHEEWITQGIPGHSVEQELSRLRAYSRWEH